MKEVKCRISTVHRVSNDTLFIDIYPDQRIEADDYYEMKNAALKLGEGEAFYNIINVGAFTLPTKKAREASCSLEGSYYKKAEAFVLTTALQKMMCKIALKLNKPVVPTRCFDSIQKAEDWLKEIKEIDLKVQTAS